MKADSSNAKGIAREVEQLRATVASLERRVEESIRSAQRLSMRDAVTRVLGQSTSLADAAATILRAVCETLGWQIGALWVVEPHTDVLRCVEVWRSPSSSISEFERVTRESTFAKGSGMPGRVWESRQSSWISDITSDDNFPRKSVAATEGLRSALGFPIDVCGEIVGVMEFFSKDIRQPDDELLEMLRIMGSQIGQFSERKHAEQMLDRFFTLSIDMLCIAGYDGYFRRLNPAWERTLGYTVQELTSAPFLDFVHPEDRETTIAEVQKLAAGELTVSFENRYRAKDGTYRWMLWTAAPFAQSQLIYAAARDITERKRSEENILRLQGEAEAANQAKTEFLARMSHEIRTPLNVLIGMGDLLERTGLTAEQGQYVRVLQKAGNNLLALIKDVLDLARVESGRIVLEDIDFEIEHVMDATLEIMGVRARQKGISLVSQIMPHTPSRLTGDPDRLRQVLINLVNNAIKFTSQGQVIVRVEPDPEATQPGTLRFSVSDTGIGIPPEKMEAIFEAFTQADASTTRKYGGTGLGLAISKRFVTLMGGRIWAENLPSGGAAFWFTAVFSLPPADSECTTVERRKEIEPIVAGPIAGLRMLVVDDSEENRFLVAEYFKSLGCHLDYAEDGMSALTKFRQGTYDIVLMDLQMPVMDGYTATRHMREWEAEQKLEAIPIIALTASALDTELQNALNAGCTACLRKPVRLVALIETVKKYAPPSKPGAEGSSGRIIVRANPRIRAVIPKYLASRRADVDSILAALPVEGYDTIQRLGHKMSGTGGGYGFPKITEIGIAIERAAKERDDAGIRTWTDELSRFLDQVEVQ